MPMPDRSMTHLTSILHRGLLMSVAIVFACPSDDTTPSDGSGSAGTTASATTASSTNGITSTSSASSSSGSTSDPTAASEPTTADSTGTPPPEDACMCVEPWPEEQACGTEELVAWVPGCPEAEPCSRLTVACPRPGVDLYDCTSELVYDEAAMQCMLETLRDGTLARLELDGTMDGGIFSSQSIYVIHVLEGRMAVRAGCFQSDIGAQLYGPDLHTLADADYFTGCIDMAAPDDRYECMMDGLGEGAMLQECAM